jgi:hypothetical protein
VRTDSQPDQPCLAASPDDLAGDEVTLEIKCPYSARDKLIDHTTVLYLSADGTLCANHNYVYQVQGQMFCTNRSVCHLAVFTLSDFKFIHVPRDDAFITEMIKRLDEFYSTYFKPALSLYIVIE